MRVQHIYFPEKETLDKGNSHSTHRVVPLDKSIKDMYSFVLKMGFFFLLSSGDCVYFDRLSSI